MESDDKYNKSMKSVAKSAKKLDKQLQQYSGKHSNEALQVLEALPLPSYYPKKLKTDRIIAANKHILQIAPRDGLESMLAVQMVSMHHAAMECLRQASFEGQSLEARESYLSQAAKLSALFTRQMEALDKHRGKGQQKVTVEHVHVESGGQAVVGSVHTGERMLERRPSDVEQPVRSAPPRQREPLRSRRVRTGDDKTQA